MNLLIAGNKVSLTQPGYNISIGKRVKISAPVSNIPLNFFPSISGVLRGLLAYELLEVNAIRGSTLRGGCNQTGLALQRGVIEALQLTLTSHKSKKLTHK